MKHRLCEHAPTFELTEALKWAFEGRKQIFFKLDETSKYKHWLCLIIPKKSIPGIIEALQYALDNRQTDPNGLALSGNLVTRLEDGSYHAVGSAAINLNT